ncbi:hypothetical protein COCOBI_07-6520 [Coccomyxa sp. Obi]|nr:hypothetical protein COCOBI_07-6520 [Coccomyxa sp. Obi]
MQSIGKALAGETVKQPLRRSFSNAAAHVSNLEQLKEIAGRVPTIREFVGVLMAGGTLLVGVDQYFTHRRNALIERRLDNLVQQLAANTAADERNFAAIQANFAAIQQNFQHIEWCLGDMQTTINDFVETEQGRKGGR